MATLIGKIFVFVILTLSLLCAAVAVGVFTNRIDWPGPEASATGDVQGRYNEIKAAYERVANAKTGELLLARLRWQTIRDDLYLLETRRPEYLKWYDQQIKILQGEGECRDDNGKAVACTIKKLAPTEGKPDLDKLGLPVRPVLETVPDVDGKPWLESRATYTAQLQETDAKIKATTDSMNKLIKEEKALTLQVGGEEGKQRGLHDLVEEEKAIRRHAAEELEYIRPLRVNREAERDLLVQRRNSLKQRKEELESRLGLAGRAPATDVDSLVTPRHNPRP